MSAECNKDCANCPFACGSNDKEKDEEKDKD